MSHVIVGQSPGRDPANGEGGGPMIGAVSRFPPGVGPSIDTGAGLGRGRRHGEGVASARLGSGGE
jgi:hypothetical protein